MSSKTVKWLDKPEDHDFPAAESYLSLTFSADAVFVIVRALEESKKVRHWAAKDILRASGLPELSADNRHVAKDLEKVKNGEPLSPVLLVRGSFERLIVADGYHRICTSYYLDENTMVPGIIVGPDYGSPAVDAP